ncbi:MAG: alpha-L-glutamate ligase-like protein [Oscillatoria sp. SIO1A7]|nr:alpha-L-glutamate ligase-like protein [Oscillatoria sp. SIO1A7]
MTIPYIAHRDRDPVGDENHTSPQKLTSADQIARHVVVSLVGVGLLLVTLHMGLDSVLALDRDISLVLPPQQAMSFSRAIAAFDYLQIIELRRLSPELQQSLTLILLFPITALATAICRNAIGLTTFGVFVPPLIALALTVSDWELGLLFALTILLLGLLLRMAIEPLKLVMVPRLGILLTAAVLWIVLGISTLEYCQWTHAGHRILLPIVILAGLIERLFITLEEEGTTYTLKRLLNTLIVGACCYLVLASPGLGKFILSYPEAHLFTIAGMVSIGRYSGYRVSELFRFKDFSTPSPTPLIPFSPSLTSIAAFLKTSLSSSLGNLLHRLGLHQFSQHPGSYLSMPQCLTHLKSCLNLSWARPGELKERGVLGINNRNSNYVLVYNPRSSYPQVDNKVLTKQLCVKWGITAPKTYSEIQFHGEIQQQLSHLAKYPDFVIKPARGHGGQGILILAQQAAYQFITPSGKQLTMPDLQHHLSRILSGLYSLGGQPDTAIIEQRLVPHARWDAIAVQGIPDIRLILFQGIPIMAMTRLPTLASQGKANLHQGGIAMGIDLVTGQTYGGVCNNRVITTHPDTGQPLAGFLIPHWESILAASIQLACCLDLDYIGIDFAIDATEGPMVLDVNARPGLAIQIANRQGICCRLEFVDRQLGIKQMKSPLDPSQILHLLPEINTISRTLS